MKRTAAILVFSSVLALAGTVPSDAGGSSWCSSDPTPPCIESAFRNGTEIFSGDPTWDITLVAANIEGARQVSFGILHTSTGYELGSAALTDQWEFTIDLGTRLPRVAFAHADDTAFRRFDDGDGTYRIRINGSPVSITQGCNTSSWPWTCPETGDSAESKDAALDGVVTDYGSWEDVDQREAFWGMNYATNVDATSLPPEIVSDPATGDDRLLIRLANSHYHPTGPTVVEGFAHLRIPNLFLRRVYGVDMPATLTSSGLVTTGAGAAATVNVYQETGDDAMIVEIDGMHFSSRSVKISRGVITPTRPTDLRARRLSAYRGRVGFDASRPRGSRITGYKARCVSRAGSDVETATADESPIVVRGLTPGVAYDCRVRALSKAGPGRWSAEVKIPRYA